MIPNADYQGIIILGFPRSGTTLLRRLLNAHPNIHCPPETNVLSAAARFIHEEGFAGGVSVGVLSGLGFSGIAEHQTLEQVRAFVFGLLNQVRVRSGKTRWAEKTAFDSFHVESIEKLCGEHCRYICVTRHPLDAVCSVEELANKMQTYLPELHEYVRRFPAPLEAFAHAWVDVNSRICRFAGDHPDICVVLRYEDLTADPVAQLEKVFALLDEPVDIAALVDHAMNETSDDVGLGDWKTYQTKTVNRASVGRWTALDHSTVAALVRIVDPVMRRLSYDPIHLPHVEEEEARRKYQIGLMAAQMRTAAAKPETNEPME